MLDSTQQRRSVLERLYHCKSALVVIGHHPDAQTEGSLKLIGSVDRLLQAALIAFEEAWIDAGLFGSSERVEQERQALCDEYTAVLHELTNVLLPTLEGSNPNSVPTDLLPLIGAEVQRVASDLNIDSVILSSSYDYNYFVKYYDFAPWYQLIDRPLPEEDSRPFLLITLPRFERDSTPLHAVLLGHELGHVRTWATGVLDSLNCPVPPEFLAEAATPQAEAALEELCESIQMSWFAEFAADIYSALCLGPAALLALGELTVPVGPLDIDSRTHPSTARRLAVILKILDDSGFRDIDDEPLAVILEQYRREANEEHSSAPLLEAIWPAVRGQLDQLVQNCDASLSSEERFKSERWNEVRRGAEDLARGLPIGEAAGRARQAVDVPTILNAAWLRKMQGLDELDDELGLDPSTMEGFLRANAVLDQLVLKSFEIAATLRH